MIDSTRFGSITINGREYESDVIVTWEGKVKEAETETRHMISESELLKLLFERPDVIVIGTGQNGEMEIGKDARKFVKKKRITLVARPTPRAVEKFNQLQKSGKKVVAYMHVTC